ncbi:hypothetical protein Tco_1323510, partial [Tanacetum coccineum]
MTWNKEHLDEYQDIKGGLVTFRGSKGRITGKGNRVLFTESECLVLSPDFKMPDESQVLLKSPKSKIGKQHKASCKAKTTATVKTLANGIQELVASIDNNEYVLTEASVKSKLQLADATGIHNLPDAEIYDGLATLGPTLTFVADEVTTTSVGVGTKGATTTTPSLDAGLDSGNIHESSLKSYDAP